MLKQLADRVRHEQKGITGLETAIVLIAFVVVAAVFAFSVLNTGLFSADKSKESVNAGLTQTRSNLELKGAVIAQKTGAATVVETIRLFISTASGSEPVDFSANSLVITYQDDSKSVIVPAANIAIAPQGRDNNDGLLDPGEIREVVITLPNAGNDAVNLGTNTNFTLEIRPPIGSVLTINRTTPSSLKDVMNLH